MSPNDVKLVQSPICTVAFDLKSNLYCQPKSVVEPASPRPLGLGYPFAGISFLVAIPRGSHPFPSRTRKLSLAGPMILHGQLCGNVGRRRD